MSMPDPGLPSKKRGNRALGWMLTLVVLILGTTLFRPHEAAPGAAPAAPMTAAEHTAIANAYLKHPDRPGVPPLHVNQSVYGEVLVKILAGTEAAYAGQCRCPYDNDASGKPCGDTSAWTKNATITGKPLVCYADDISPEIAKQYGAV